MRTPGKRSTQRAATRNPYAISKEKYLSEPEYEFLHRYLEYQERHSPRDTALIFTALYTGARASEILEIRQKDLIQEDQSVRIRGLKNSHNREVPVPAWLYQQLESLSQESEGPFIFNIGYQRLHQIWLSFRRTRKTFHALRHTFAIRTYKRTKDIHLVQKALGHKNLKNTLVYLHYVSSKDEMKKLLDPGALRL